MPAIAKDFAKKQCERDLRSSNVFNGNSSLRSKSHYFSIANANAIAQCERTLISLIISRGKFMPSTIWRTKAERKGQDPKNLQT